MDLYNICKRGFDILVSLLAAAVLSPVLAVIVIVIRLESCGPAIFKQERAGKNGKPFAFYKFRTMRADVDPFGPSPKSSEDHRLTYVGKFLREYSLDELPQLFNVLKGDMSIVGPRPLYLSQISEWSDYHKQRLLVKPGLTGLSQIKGRASLTQEAKLDIEVEYVKRQSFWLDIKIIFLTFGVVFGKKGVYEKQYSEKQQTRGEKELSYMKVALIGSVSSSWCVVDALIHGGVEITAVLGVDESQADKISDYRSLRSLATNAGIPFRSFVKVSEPAVEKFLREHIPDMIWVIGLSQLVPESLIKIAPYGGVGFHPTMLPEGRGRAPVAWTILKGERAAVNLFFLADEPDAGDIIVQREVQVLPDDYSEDLIHRTNLVLRDVILELAPLIKAGKIPRTVQDHSKATYYPKRTPADGLIDWSASTGAIYRLIRAAGRPYPGAFTWCKDHKLIVWRGKPAELKKVPQGAQPGRILATEEDGSILVAAGNGGIWLTEIELEGIDESEGLLHVGAQLGSLKQRSKQ